MGAGAGDNGFIHVSGGGQGMLSGRLELLSDLAKLRGCISVVAHV
jgi:hypothetical protein